MLSVGGGGTLKILTAIALVIFTAGLAWATFKLAQYTKAFSKLTERLLRIEKSRDDRDRRENRQKDLQMALAAAEAIQAINPNEFAQNLNKPSDIPLLAMRDIERLHFTQKVRHRS